MRTSAIAFLLVGGSFALNQAAGAGYHKVQTHKMTAELVSKDTSASTITVRNLATHGKAAAEPETTTGGSTGNEIVLHVEGRAAARLSALQTGDSLILTCRGGHNASSDNTAHSGKVPASTAGTSTTSECAAVTVIQKASEATKSPKTEKPQR
jgi:hypothetical protein